MILNKKTLQELIETLYNADIGTLDEAPQICKRAEKNSRSTPCRVLWDRLYKMLEWTWHDKISDRNNH